MVLVSAVCFKNTASSNIISPVSVMLLRGAQRFVTLMQPRHYVLIHLKDRYSRELPGMRPTKMPLYADTQTRR